MPERYSSKLSSIQVNLASDGLIPTLQSRKGTRPCSVCKRMICLTPTFVISSPRVLRLHSTYVWKVPRPGAAVPPRQALRVLRLTTSLARLNLPTPRSYTTSAVEISALDFAPVVKLIGSLMIDAQRLATLPLQLVRTRHYGATQSVGLIVRESRTSSTSLQPARNIGIFTQSVIAPWSDQRSYGVEFCYPKTMLRNSNLGTDLALIHRQQKRTYGDSP